MQEPQETQVWSLSREGPLQEGMTTYSSILAWRIPMDRGPWRATVHRVAKSRTWLKWLSTHTPTFISEWNQNKEVSSENSNQKPALMQVWGWKSYHFWNQNPFSYLFLNIYLFIYLWLVLVAVQIFDLCCFNGIMWDQVPWPGMRLGDPLRRYHWVLATGPQGSSPKTFENGPRLMVFSDACNKQITSRDMPHRPKPKTIPTKFLWSLVAHHPERQFILCGHFTKINEGNITTFLLSIHKN